MPEKRQWSPEDAVRRETAEFSGRTRDMILGEISNDQFRQFRLERGVYGQRQAGVQMVRIKIPYGGLTPRQLKRIAEITARFGHGIAHLTTRQDIQLHYVNLKDIPAIMELLAEADITTREACGNTVRNVTACPFAGVCRDEAFDVTPHAHRTAAHLMRNPSTAGLGRKFKISFSGCDSRCGLIAIHDIGLQAVLRSANGATERGFKVLVGGGLGAAPKAAQVFSEFVPEDELIPLCEAITRVFFLHGERDRRMKARMKFMIEDIGIESFRELVQTELSGLTRQIPVAALDPITPVASGGNGSAPTPPALADRRWLETNVYSQRQAGFYAVTVRLILGDISATTLTDLSDLAAHHTADIRVTPEQNFLFRWIPEANLAGLYDGLKTLGLSDAGAGRLADITACPGADTCNLGITSSKGLARQFTSGFADTLRRFADADIKIKISGCPNSCGQHHIADIGFYGCSTKIKGRVAPAFELMIGGHIGGDSVEFAKPLMKIPSRRLPEVLDTLLRHVEDRRKDDETFGDYVRRVGLETLRSVLAPYADTSNGQDDPDLFTDWGGHSDFVLNVKPGECAGVQVDLTDALLARARAHLVDASTYHGEGEFGHAAYSAYSGIVQAAKSVIIADGIHATSYHQIMSEFRLRLEQAGNGALSDFNDRIAEFKQSVPDEAMSSSNREFAGRIVDWVTQWLNKRSNDSDT